MTPLPDGTRIEGNAVYTDASGAVSLSYMVETDREWLTRTARVTGWTPDREIYIAAERTPDGWRINGAHHADIGALIDIDLGFTPATNTIAIRRLSLAVGEKSDTAALWLDTDDWDFGRLDQVYERTGECHYLYRSPAHGYEAELTVDACGLVGEYPGLWSRFPEP